MKIWKYCNAKQGKRVGLFAAVAIPMSLIVAAQVMEPAAGIKDIPAADQAFDSSGNFSPGCSQFMIVNVRGTRASADTSNTDTVTRSFTDDFTKVIASAGLPASARQYQYITYDTPTLAALLSVVGIPHDLHTGVVNTRNYLLPELDKCGNSIFILDGYSFGAWIVKDVYNALPNYQRQRVLLAAYGDPTFDPFQSWDDGGSFGRTPGIYAIVSFSGPYAARAGRNNPYPGYTGPQVLDTCLHNDLVCQSCCSVGIHENGYTPLWTLNAAIWAFKRWRAGIPV